MDKKLSAPGEDDRWRRCFCIILRSSGSNFSFSIFLFLFLTTGVYGDVHRVKILFNKKDTALIQMAEPHQAQLGDFKIIVSDVTRHWITFFFFLSLFLSQRWLTWTSWNFTANSCELCRLSTRASRCPKKDNRMPVWPRTLSTRLFIASRSPAARIIRISTPLHLLSICRIFRKSSFAFFRIIHSCLLSWQFGYSFYLLIYRPNVTEEEIKNAFTAANFAPQAFKFFP